MARTPSKKICSEDECCQPLDSWGLCRKHYQAGHPKVMHFDPCSAEGCERLVGLYGSKGLCSLHYKRSAKAQKKLTALCSWPDCADGVEAKGMCGMHYQRERATRKRLARSGNPMLICQLDGCFNEHFAKRMCEAHYEAHQRAGWKKGSPTAYERFEAEVDRTNTRLPRRAPALGPCHLWMGSLDDKGFGVFILDGRIPAHKAAVLLNGEYLKGEYPVHRCGVHACVRRSHLRLVAKSAVAA